tara:strand:- start:2298 stop:2768 length:471 start_codon:yes stop_codon:yes gene_type:complete
MLEQRNYNIIREEEDKIIALKPDSEQMIVFISNTQKFNVKNIQLYISIMNELEIFHAIIIYKEGVTSFTKKAIEQTSEMVFELFLEEDLQVNITKHKYQPNFEKLSLEEATKIKEFSTQFPILKKDDPISRFYNYTKGDVIKVIRKNNNIIYRIVK